MSDKNRENSADYLAQREIPFVQKNGGAHLIVEGKDCFIDFWPGTGKWHSRCGKKGFGVRNLVAFIETPSNAMYPANLRNEPNLETKMTPAQPEALRIAELLNSAGQSGVGRFGNPSSTDRF